MVPPFRSTSFLLKRRASVVLIPLLKISRKKRGGGYELVEFIRQTAVINWEGIARVKKTASSEPVKAWGMYVRISLRGTFGMSISVQLHFLGV